MRKNCSKLGKSFIHSTPAYEKRHYNKRQLPSYDKIFQSNYTLNSLVNEKFPDSLTNHTYGIRQTIRMVIAIPTRTY